MADVGAVVIYRVPKELLVSRRSIGTRMCARVAKLGGKQDCRQTKILGSPQGTCSFLTCCGGYFPSMQAWKHARVGKGGQEAAFAHAVRFPRVDRQFFGGEEETFTFTTT